MAAPPLRPIRLLLALALSGAVLSGCGGDSEDDLGGPLEPTEPPAGLSVEVRPGTVEPGGVVRAGIRNESDVEIVYGEGYSLQREVDGDLEPVPLPAEPIREIGLVAPAGGSGPKVTVRIPRDAEPGTYRVILDERAEPGVFEVK